MIYKYLIVACFIAFYFFLVSPPIFDNLPDNRIAAKAETLCSNTNSVKPFFLDKPFPSFLTGESGIDYSPTEWWCGENKNNPQDFPIFQLSQNYPKDEPAKQNFAWQDAKYDEIFYNSPAKDKWKNLGRNYLIKVLKYAFESNISKDGKIENDWNPTSQPNPKWFHAPWLHANKKDNCKDRGREFVHGLTAERCSCREELKGEKECPKSKLSAIGIYNNACDNSEGKVQNWGVAYFNEPGGYNLGRIWQEMTVHEKDAGKYPNPSKFKDMDFPDGTVIIKLLFTSATDAEAAYLTDSKLVWRTDLNRAKKTKLPDEIESFPKLRLLQIDLSVRDHRANAYSGWVFGTFSYNPDTKKNLSDELGDYNGWENVEPLGLMFGNDPTVAQNGFKNLEESLVNESVIGTQHLGCGERLNGTVDNPKSSCIACHAQKSEVQVSKTAGVSVNFTEIKYIIDNPSCNIEGNGDLTKDDLLYWFKNVRPKEVFSRNTDNLSYYPLHNVLQLQIGIARYCDAFPKNCNEEKTLEKMKKKGVEYLIMKESSRGIN